MLQLTQTQHAIHSIFLSLNEEPPDEQGDEIHDLLEDQVHLYEGEHKVLSLSHLTAVLCDEDDHQHDEDISFDGPHEHGVFDLNIQASDHQPDGEINFGGPHDYCVFDLTLVAILLPPYCSACR